MRFATFFPVALCLSTLSASTFAAHSTADDLDTKARAIDSRILKIDAHTDVLLPGAPELNYSPGHTSRTDLDNLRSGGIGAVAFAIAVGPGPRTPEGTKAARAEADAKLAWIQSYVKEHADAVAVALSANDIERIHAAGKVAVIESFLNARSIGSDISAIDTFYGQGVRLFGFTHAGNNEWADSSRPTGEPAVEHHGLSPLGKRAVARLNELGVIIDVSQLTPDGVLQVIALSKAPVIASHSDIRALVDNSRNLSDAEVDAIGRNGGVVHLTAFNPYLRPLSADFDAKAAVLRQKFGLPPTTRHGPIGAEEGIEITWESELTSITAPASSDSMTKVKQPTLLGSSCAGVIRRTTSARSGAEISCECSGPLKAPPGSFTEIFGPGTTGTSSASRVLHSPGQPSGA